MSDEPIRDTDEFTITGPDGETETVELPAGLVDALADPGESETTIAADFLVQTFAQRTHAYVHHTPGSSSHIQALNQQMEQVFEDRFGVSVAEAMDHED